MPDVALLRRRREHLLLGLLALLSIRVFLTLVCCALVCMDCVHLAGAALSVRVTVVPVIFMHAQGAHAAYSMACSQGTMHAGCADHVAPYGGGGGGDALVLLRDGQAQSNNVAWDF